MMLQYFSQKKRSEMLEKELNSARHACEEFERKNNELNAKIFKNEYGGRHAFFLLLQSALSVDLSWYDYEELAPSERQKYAIAARHMLENPAFLNEFNFMKSNWGKQAILEFADKNPEERREHIAKVSWMLMGIEFLRKRLEEIRSPELPRQETGDIFKGI
jgi:hypothetical protein